MKFSFIFLRFFSFYQRIQTKIIIVHKYGRKMLILLGKFKLWFQMTSIWLSNDRQLNPWIFISVWSSFFVHSHANHLSCSKCGEIYGWTNWSECSASFNGTMRRNRGCHSSPYGKNCYYGTEFVFTDYRKCNMDTYRKLAQKSR